jgi:D-xylose transport system ATP-binding protein
MQNAPLVELVGINKSFGGVQAVDNVSLQVFPGQVVGLLGHNGAGKSTLIKILSGAFKADSGAISVSGNPVKIANPNDARNHGIETIYQNLALADNLDASGNLFLGREKRRLKFFADRQLMRSETAEICRQINPRFTNLTTPVRNLSGGQRQSVAIARAVYFNAKLLIMDEPTAALGPGETKHVKELIQTLKARGVGILLISHDIDDVFEAADELVVMAGGRVVGRRKTSDATRNEILSLIIMGPDALPGQQQQPPATTSGAPHPTP